MKSYPISLFACLLFSLSLNAQVVSSKSENSSQFILQLKSGSFIPPKNISTERLSQFNRQAIVIEGKSFAIIQFEQIPSTAERVLLQESGIELLDYVPNNAFTVSITKELNTKLLNQLKARSVIELTAEQKMQTDLANGIFLAKR
jgi:hypothetical protein